MVNYVSLFCKDLQRLFRPLWNSPEKVDPSSGTRAGEILLADNEAVTEAPGPPPSLGGWPGYPLF